LRGFDRGRGEVVLDLLIQRRAACDSQRRVQRERGSDAYKVVGGVGLFTVALHGVEQIDQPLPQGHVQRNEVEVDQRLRGAVVRTCVCVCVCWMKRRALAVQPVSMAVTTWLRTYPSLV
jgi:hypothetical protein